MIKRNCPVCGKQNDITIMHGRGSQMCFGCKNIMYIKDGEIIGVRDRGTGKMLWGNFTG